MLQLLSTLDFARTLPPTAQTSRHAVRMLVPKGFVDEAVLFLKWHLRRPRTTMFGGGRIPHFEVCPRESFGKQMPQGALSNGLKTGITNVAAGKACNTWQPGKTLAR